MKGWKRKPRKNFLINFFINKIIFTLNYTLIKHMSSKEIGRIFEDGTYELDPDYLDTKIRMGKMTKSLKRKMYTNRPDVIEKRQKYSEDPLVKYKKREYANLEETKEMKKQKKLKNAMYNTGLKTLAMYTHIDKVINDLTKDQELSEGELKLKYVPLLAQVIKRTEEDLTSMLKIINQNMKDKQERIEKTRERYQNANKEE